MLEELIKIFDCILLNILNIRYLFIYLAYGKVYCIKNKRKKD